MADGFAELTAELRSLFRRGVDASLDDRAFDELALRVFRYQLGANPVYRRFCEARGAGGEAVRTWRDVPPVPTTAFRHLRLLSAPPDRADGPAEAVFRTSGTTRGPGRRGEHHVLSLGLYREAALPNFAAHLLPGLASPPTVLCLLPSPEEAPDSSLSRMAGFVVEALGSGGGWFVDPERGLRADALRQALARAVDAGEPVVVLGTAFSFVHWLDRGEDAVRLPEGSRVMETGGFKGRSRAVARPELYRRITGALGVPVGRIVNEYGMTELLSQFYEPVLRGDGDAGDDLDARRHAGPPWVRTRALDPRTLEPVPDGERGLLCHLDLANVGSVACVLTEDVGFLEGPPPGRRFRVLGRAEGAEPRGCSLAMEELAEAAHDA